MYTFAYDVSFPSLGAYLDAVEQTRVHGRYAILGKHDSSVRGGAFHGPPLHAFVPRCRTMQGFEAEIALISELATAMEHTLPALQTIKRQRVRGRSGSAVNVHTVLRGDLAHAWKRMVRTPQSGVSINTAVLIPLAYGAWAEEEQIRLTMACNVALLSALEASGRSCDVWAVSANATAFEHRGGHRQLLHLKHAGSVWDLHGLVCICDKAFYRRLGFRMLEAQQTRMPLQHAYGGRGSGFWPQCLAQTRVDLGYAPDTTLHGACQDDNITTRERAQQWLSTTLAGFSHE